ncbi:hypothetical protein [Pseudoduganella chitinolytica]|uniref:DUF3108 domain-containing protein n=1 Tax=Pseudoduganella chitinolytica TaxID=34070 RepID=A0ABY8BEA3_9BURK|nr:hypothetical protein [Pseudoduganella chitinolytica]WEF32689.1 hypothetical protein PX653_25310 [Pseudoduganella chitinolytica]
MLRHSFAALFLLPVLASAGLPAPAQEPVPNVVVTATRDPVDKSYRKMVRGMDRFVRQQATLAPGATLRFRLLPRLPGTRMEGIALKVVGDTVTLPVAVAPDNSFTLERDERAWREDASLVANRRTTSMTWRADVRSPGVPDGQRRLGDLRLECLVGMEAGLISNNSHLFAWLSNLLTDPDEVCGNAEGNYLFFTERPVFAVTLRAGERSAQLPPRFLYAGGSQAPNDLPYCDCQVLLDRSYYAPLWDRGWPDDTLLSFEYMDEPAPPNAPSAPGIAPGQDRAQVRETLGTGTEVDFGNGLQAWLYPPVQRKLQPGQLQYLVLFGADGRVVKSRAALPFKRD